jgi:NADPH-dependent glutamate synthase beta subunit-like oxidoreductase
MKYIDLEVHTPLCAFSTTSSLENKTGSWRFANPVFVDRISSCINECPAGEDISGIMYYAAQGNFETAWRLIMNENPFPAIMGRICYHTCETKCNRGEYDEAVSIHSVERFIGDYGLANNLKAGLISPEIDKKIAIVGAGPAGLTAAYYLRLMGYKTRVFDANRLPGGLMRYGIPPYRLPKEILEGEISRLRDMGIEFEMDVRIGIDNNWEEIENRFDAVFVAIGAYHEGNLDIEGIDREGVYHALEFLHKVNTAEYPETGKKITVIGGGNSALDCARVSRRMGAEVTLVYRRSAEEMPAHPEEVEMAEEEGVRIIFLAGPKHIYGDRDVNGITLEKMVLGEKDRSGRRRPVATGETFELDCQTVIVAIGEFVRVEDLPPLLPLKGTLVKTDDRGRTGRSTLFAGGDIVDIPHTVTHAVGSGKRAAIAIDEFLSGRQTGKNVSNTFTLPFHRKNPTSEIVGFGGLNTFYFDHRPRIKIHIMPVNKRLAGFKEVAVSHTDEEVTAEARRCFNCGLCTECGNCDVFCPEISIKKNPDGYGYMIDLDYCKGCGICVEECPRGAMKMEFMG